MHGEMEQQFSLNLDQLPENSKTKYKLVKLVLMFQFLYHYQCFHLLVTKNHSMETSTSTVKMELNSSLNGKQLQQDGNKKTNSHNFQLHSLPINESSIAHDR